MKVNSIINLITGTENKYNININDIKQIEHNLKNKTPYMITYLDNNIEKKNLYYDGINLSICPELGDKLLLIIFDSIREYRENKGNNKTEFIECIKKIHELKGESVLDDEKYEYIKVYEELFEKNKIKDMIKNNKKDIIKAVVKNEQTGGFPFPIPVPIPLLPFLTSFLIEWLGLKLFGMGFIRLLELFIEPIFAVGIKIILKVLQLIGKAAGVATAGVGLLISTVGGILGVVKSLLLARAHTIKRYKDQNGVETQKFQFSIKYLILSIIDIGGAIIALIPVVGWFGIGIKWIVFFIKFFADLAKLSKDAVEIINTETNLKIPTISDAIQSVINKIIKKSIKLIAPKIKKELVRIKENNPTLYKEIKNKQNRDIIYDKFESSILQQIMNQIGDENELREQDIELLDDIKIIIRTSIDNIIDNLIEEIDSNNTKRIKINYDDIKQDKKIDIKQDKKIDIKEEDDDVELEPFDMNDALID